MVDNTLDTGKSLGRGRDRARGVRQRVLGQRRGAQGEGLGQRCGWVARVKLLSRVWLLATPWTAAYQAPLSMGFSRQEYWSGLPLPSPNMWYSYKILNYRCNLFPYQQDRIATWPTGHIIMMWHHGEESYCNYVSMFILGPCMVLCSATDPSELVTMAMCG